jgi:hypothetical protein
MKQEKLYPVYFSEQELLVLEEALYDRASLLGLIARDLLDKKEKQKAHDANEKSYYLETLAGKVAIPLDEIYAEMAKSQMTKTKESK